MPNRLIQSNETAEVSDPNRCVVISDLIKSLTKSEVKILRMKTQTRRAITDVEFTKIKSLYFQFEEEEKRAVVKYGFQFK